MEQPNVEQTFCEAPPPRIFGCGASQLGAYGLTISMFGTIVRFKR